MTIATLPKAKLQVRPTQTLSTEATVTVIIPCYNYGHFLPEAVDSALDQRGVSVDVVIVDDHSTDDSLAVARAIEASKPGVRVITNASNRGMVETFNAGLAEAEGEFLVRLDADDVLTPGALSRAVNLAKAYPSVGLIYGRPIHFEGSHRPEARQKATGWTIWQGRHWLAERCRSGVNVITSPEVVMRKSVVDQVGPQQPLKHTPDMEMWFRIAAFSDVGYIRGADQAWHREHPNSMSAVEVDEFRDLSERVDAFNVLFDGVAATIPGAERLRRVAMTTLASEALTAASHEYDCGRGGEPLVQQYVRLASNLHSDFRSLPEWRRLDVQVQRGSEAAARWHRSLPPRALRRLRGDFRMLRWQRSGVF